jgi:hypothetical protein
MTTTDTTQKPLAAALAGGVAESRDVEAQLERIADALETIAAHLAPVITVADRPLQIGDTVYDRTNPNDTATVTGISGDQIDIIWDDSGSRGTWNVASFGRVPK